MVVNVSVLVFQNQIFEADMFLCTTINLYQTIKKKFKKNSSAYSVFVDNFLSTYTLNVDEKVSIYALYADKTNILLRVMLSSLC